jgi:hypothetical protein
MKANVFLVYINQVCRTWSLNPTNNSLRTGLLQKENVHNRQNISPLRPITLLTIYFNIVNIKQTIK